jgi:hypothetical protein
VSQPLSDAVALALAVRPEGRPQTVEAWQRQLQRQVAGAAAEPVTRLEPAQSDSPVPSRRLPAAATAPKASPARRPIATPAPRRAPTGIDSRLLGWGIALGVLARILARLAAMLPKLPPSAPRPPTLQAPMTASPPPVPTPLQPAIPAPPVGASAELRETREAAHRGECAKGEGVPQDDHQAAAWYRRAAEQGYADAQFNLGLMYAKGEGVPSDYREGVAWIRRAAEQGHTGAQELLLELGE